MLPVLPCCCFCVGEPLGTSSLRCIPVEVGNWGASVVGLAIFGLKVIGLTSCGRLAAAAATGEWGRSWERWRRGGSAHCGGGEIGGTSPSSLRRGVLDLWHAALCQTSVEDFGRDLPRRRARAEAATGPRLGARGLWLMAL